MTGVVVRRYRADDWNAISAVHDAARLDELSRSVGTEAFLDLAATWEGEGLFDGDLWVAEVEGVVGGFIALDEGEVTWLYVEPALVRRGIGRTLLRHVLDQVDEVELTTLAGNEPALALYRSVGFEVVETRTGRLAGNEQFAATGHIMRWTAQPKNTSASS